MPAGVRATRSATITGVCASTSSFATSASAAGSADGRRAPARTSAAAELRVVGHLGQIGVDRDQRRFLHRRHRERGRLHDLFAERLQRERLRVVLDVAAHDLRDVGRGVVPFDARPAGRAVGDVADEDQHRYAIGVGVVDAHRRVLQADGVVHDDRHRLVRHLGVAVGHRGGDLFVRAREQLGLRVAAVVR